MQPAEQRSKLIKDFSYTLNNEGIGTLTVEFLNGARYSYANVSPDIVREFEAAESLGRYFNSNIRGKYASTKIGKLNGDAG